MVIPPGQRTPGQDQAVEELARIQKATGGLVAVIRVHERRSTGEYLRIDVTIDCAGPERPRALVKMIDREPFTLLIPPHFPLCKPEVRTPHRRFVHLPNVMWGNSICLYLAANDWDPSEAMWGYVTRLVTWVGAVGDGSLTGPELPWHPPLTNKQISPGTLVVHPDLPGQLEREDGLWLAWAVIEATGTSRYEVRRWLTDPPTVLPDGLDVGRYFVSPVVALPRPVGFDYPTDFAALREVLAEQGVDPRTSVELVSDARERYASMWWTDTAESKAKPLSLLVLGSPAPHRSTVPARVAHLAVWQVDHAYGARGDGLAWMDVLDQRPAVTRRRDTTRPAEWVSGKRILVLGCGAIGAPLAEFCVRAGAAAMHVVDTGVVTPGVLVRQPYVYDDIGRNKAEVLARRLRAITPDHPVHDDAWDAAAAGPSLLPEVDLIIDATANRSVATNLERMRWMMRSTRPFPPLLSVAVGHRCERGIATVALPSATGGGVDILRRLAIAASDAEDLDDVLDDFYPDLPRTELFQPEPGCSDPTYIGSAADLAACAGHLLNDALSVLSAEADPARDAAAPSRFASVVRLPTPAGPGRPPRRLEWGRDVRVTTGAGYEVRVTPEALAAIRREAIVMADERGPHCETGGLLLGQVDYASRVVWVSEADGLPPVSDARPHAVRIDPRSAALHVEERRRRTRGLVGYIGAWHTHPGLEPHPSSPDHEALHQLMSGGAPAVMMIVGGAPDRWTGWLRHGARPEVWITLGSPP
jgi:integrative and conjugative element protein (TIGR02256 family)